MKVRLLRFKVECIVVDENDAMTREDLIRQAKRTITREGWTECIEDSCTELIDVTEEWKEMQKIESWWKHNGTTSREQASGIRQTSDTADYLQETDDWWNGLSDGEKRMVYDEYFEEL
jgi:hypothetical protein